ncbi:MAG: hypothetical protein RBR28_11485 [Lentimicrobium sp.]|jgi:hypothetical protein|nr:hypothetical protein [Lentimicrobium sp.]
MIITDNAQLFGKLRHAYPVFTYERFVILAEENQLKLRFFFSIGRDIQFSPQMSLQTGQSTEELTQLLNTHSELLRNLVFHIGLIEMVSYWKCVCSPHIVIKAGCLLPEQTDWFKQLFFNGLGEFFYTNNICVDSATYVTIETTGQEKFTPQHYLTTEENFIVPVGGGKDSAVSLELLLTHGYEVVPLIMNPRGATLKTVEAAGLPADNILIINRSIDPSLLQLNERGFLNGHTPFSAMLAFYSLLATTLKGYKNIALSNESSANEPTIPGTNINHQYSKTFEFEAAFREYYTRYITSDLNYFSFLRPLNELQIMKLFSAMPRYHKLFRSCNAGSKNDTWCGVCPKCLFTHIMLSAFVGINQANDLIGAKLLDNEQLKPVFQELTGIATNKPFECVGTLDDVNQALSLIIQSHQKLPALVKYYQQYNIASPANHPNQLNPNHFVPKNLLDVLTQAIQ